MFTCNCKHAEEEGEVKLSLCHAGTINQIQNSENYIYIKNNPVWYFTIIYSVTNVMMIVTKLINIIQRND